MTAEPTRIGIAIVEFEDRFLVGVRGEESTLTGQAEFPGGKCEPEESPEDCVIRECREEACLEIRPLRLLDHRTYTYEHGTVELHFWLCEPVDGTRVRGSHQSFKWVPRNALATKNFPAANAHVVSLLVES